MTGRTITERIYQRLRREGVGDKVPGFTIERTVGGGVAPLVFARASGKPLNAGVPGLYTLPGYQAFDGAVERVSQVFADEESWVLGVKSSLDLGRKRQVADEVRRLYLEDYARTWQEFVKDIRLVRARDVQRSVNLARVLSAPDSPLPVLLRAIVREVTLVPREDADKGMFERGVDLGAKQVEKLSSKLPGKGSPSTARELASAEQIVDARFEELRAFVRGAEGKAPVDQVAPLMQEIYAHLLAVDCRAEEKAQPARRQCAAEAEG